MGLERDILKEPDQVIEEIEVQLEKLRRRRIDDIERDLVARINQEKDTARRRREDVEREFEKERNALGEYRAVVKEAEEERDGLLGQAREHFDKVVRLQAEIESLAKATVDEIKKVTEIQQKIEDLRKKTSERAGFLKADLRERFGIVADVLDEEQKALSLDLDQELEKLKKIKELLAIESAAVGLGGPAEEEKEAGDLASLDSPEAARLRIPENQDLIAESAEVGEAVEPEAALSTPAAVEAGPATPPSGTEEETEEAVREALEAWRKSEPANGNGEISYFQKDGRVLVDGESFFAAIDKTLDEARRLSEKLGQTQSPKEQFFIKQELINWQEGLRALFLRIIKMTEKKAWELPGYTAAIFNTQGLRSLLERLSLENWSNPDEFESFTAAATGMRDMFLARITPRGPYLRSVKKEVESK
jgi:hypothetical protein